MVTSPVTQTSTSINFWRKADEMDPEKRKQLYLEAQNIIYNDAPWIFGYSVDAAALYKPGLQGCQRHPIDYLNAHRITLP